MNEKTQQFSIDEYLENLNELPEYLASQKICNDIANNFKISFSIYLHNLPTKYLCADVIYAMAKRSMIMMDVVPTRLLTFEICINLLKISTEVLPYIPNDLQINVWLEFLKTITEENKLKIEKYVTIYINDISNASPKIKTEWERIKKLNIISYKFSSSE